jgi:hypothetical protein
MRLCCWASILTDGPGEGGGSSRSGGGGGPEPEFAPAFLTRDDD